MKMNILGYMQTAKDVIVQIESVKLDYATFLIYRVYVKLTLGQFYNVPEKCASSEYADSILELLVCKVGVMTKLEYLLYPLFSLEKKGILILCQSRSVVRPSVRPSVCPSVRMSVRHVSCKCISS